MKTANLKDTASFQIYSETVETIGKMVDAVHFGMVDPSTITELEFGLMRIYNRAMQSQRAL